MRIRTLFSAWGPKSLCVAALLISGCGNEQKVRQADEAYQQALAVDDLAGQRVALLALTRVNEDVIENWTRLAQIDLQMGAYGDAYAHLSRAHELDRTAVAPLSMMTELAVINGRLELVEENLKKLVVVGPNDRAVSVARGFIALRQANYERAQENVDVLLAQNSGDSIANVLQTRILVAQRKFPEALDLLNRNLALVANDRALLRSLGALHRYLGNWEKAAATDLKLWQLSPSDATFARQVIIDALRAKNLSLATTVTQRVVKNVEAGAEADTIFSAWVELAPGANALSLSLGKSLPEHSKVAFAHYLNQVGRADQALEVLGRRARPLSDRANVAFNAVFAESLLLKGQTQSARQLLDQILRDEPDNAVALSARARLLSRSGDHRGATIDAQRLVTSYGTISSHHVLLARIYRANRDLRWAERTLWDAYRDLPSDEALYKELRQVLIARGDKEALSRLESVYHEEKFSRLIKELA